MSDLIERLRGRIGPLMYQHDDGVSLTNEAADALEQKDKRITELEERLEIHPCDFDGNKLMDIVLSEDCDGIACRDETIHQLDVRLTQYKDKYRTTEGECARLERKLRQALKTT